MKRRSTETTAAGASSPKLYKSETGECQNSSPDGSVRTEVAKSGLGSKPQGGTADQPPGGMEELRKQKRELKMRLETKKERLRKLEMVKMYRTKNNLDELSSLIEKWHGVVRDGLLELHGLTSDPRPSLTQLVDHFQLDHKLIGYNPEEEGFDD